MPYKLRKAPKRELYWVVTIATGKKHSKEPIPLEKAKAQLRILESVGNGLCQGKPLVDDETWVESPVVKSLHKAHMQKVAEREFSKQNPGVLVKNAKKAKEHLEKIIGGVHPELDAIIKADESLKKFPPQRKARFEEQVAEKSRELDAKEEFLVKEEADTIPYDGEKYKVQIARSPKHPNVELINYTLIEKNGEKKPHEIGHRIVLKRKPGSTKYEYYNSTGEPFHTLPRGLSMMISGIRENPSNPVHQTTAPICERHSLERGCFSGTNAEYNAMLQKEAKATGKTIDELIWDKTKHGGALKGTNVAMSLFPAINSAKTVAQAIQYYRTIITPKEKDELNHYVSLVTNKHWRNFADIPTIGEMNHIINLILKHGELRASAPSWTPEPTEAEKLESVRKSWGSSRRVGGAEEDVDAELAELMGALPMPAEERPHAPAPRGRVHRVGRLPMFEPPPIRAPARGLQHRRGTKRTHSRMETGRGKCMNCGLMLR